MKACIMFSAGMAGRSIHDRSARRARLTSSETTGRSGGVDGTVRVNCRLDRNVRELVENQPFGSVNIAEFSLKKAPRTHGYIYQGVAPK